MAEYIDKSDIIGLVQIGWSGDAIVNAIINDGISSVPAIPIPEGATNGDMIKAMFPNFKINEEWKATRHFELRTDCTEITGIATSDWWYAPYKKEVKE